MDTPGKHKNIRRLFAKTLKGLDKQRDKIPVYNFEPIEYDDPHIAAALAEDYARENSFFRSELRLNFIIYLQDSQREDNTLETSGFDIKNLNDDALNSIKKRINDESILEKAKNELLNVVHFDGLKEMEDSNVSISIVPEEPTNGKFEYKVSYNSRNQKF